MKQFGWRRRHDQGWTHVVIHNNWAECWRLLREHVHAEGGDGLVAVTAGENNPTSVNVSIFSYVNGQVRGCVRRQLRWLART
jgi:hypothetical protein